MSKKLKMFWWKPFANIRYSARFTRDNSFLMSRRLLTGKVRFSNFGDEFSQMALEYATGKKVIWASPETAEIFGLGSIMAFLEMAKNPVTVWGAGVHEPSDKFCEFDYEQHSFPIVRGRETLSYLRLDSKVTSIGDPGLLISEFVGPSKVRSNTPLYIPHFSELNSQSGLNLIDTIRSCGFRVCLPDEHPLHVGNEISKSSFVLTSSLHARIFSDTLGIPSISLHNAFEPTFKYRDYASSVGVGWKSIGPDELLSHLESGTIALQATNEIDGRELEKCQSNLLTAARSIS
jgi:pyruvyltransferase